jgi:hypothetical protein
LTLDSLLVSPDPLVLEQPVNYTAAATVAQRIVAPVQARAAAAVGAQPRALPQP